jgi:hypothetical protein
MSYGGIAGTGFALYQANENNCAQAHLRKGIDYGYEQNNWNRFGDNKLGCCRNGRQRAEGLD